MHACWQRQHGSQNRWLVPSLPPPGRHNPRTNYRDPTQPHTPTHAHEHTHTKKKQVLDLSIGSVKPSDTLSSHKREQGLANPDFSAPPAIKPAGGLAGLLPDGVPPPPGGMPPTGVAAEGGVGAVGLAPGAAPYEGLLANLHMYVQVSPSLGQYAEKLKRVVPVAVDRAICDIITPVVERSVTIACCTTKELVTKVREKNPSLSIRFPTTLRHKAAPGQLCAGASPCFVPCTHPPPEDCVLGAEFPKPPTAHPPTPPLQDFVLEPDEQRMRKAAHMMVSSLAGSLALVTCKEPLRLSVSNQLRQLLVTAGLPPDQQLIEQAVQQLTGACVCFDAAASFQIETSG